MLAVCDLMHDSDSDVISGQCHTHTTAPVIDLSPTGGAASPHLLSTLRPLRPLRAERHYKVATEPAAFCDAGTRGQFSGRFR
jgi:hypothetical protein